MDAGRYPALRTISQYPSHSLNVMIPSLFKSISRSIIFAEASENIPKCFPMSDSLICPLLSMSN